MGAKSGFDALELIEEDYGLMERRNEKTPLGILEVGTEDYKYS